MRNRKLSTLAKYLEFDDEATAAEYIMLSEQNGNRKDAAKMFNDLMPGEKAQCLLHLRDVAEADSVLLMAVRWLQRGK